jgi:putative chitinase
VNDLLTLEQLVAAMPRSARVAPAFVGWLNSAFESWGIDTPDRVAAFLAQAAHESDELQALEENLNYSAEGLLRTWPRRFSPDDAAFYQRQPERIANRAYAHRLGNGDEASGDGWRFRGRGIFQLTGRANYRAASVGVCGDADTLLFNPELVATPPYACETAGWYWHTRGLNRFADRADFEGLTRAINGGTNGLVDRVAHWHRAIEALA